jgi:sulfate transport system permease protein
MLFLPLAGMILKAARVSPTDFWEMATSPEAIATYKISFGLSLVASLINGIFGLIIACVRRQGKLIPHCILKTVDCVGCCLS